VLLEAETILARIAPDSAEQALALRDLGQIAAAAGDHAASVELPGAAAEMLTGTARTS
jgi:hypothetical protein